MNVNRVLFITQPKCGSQWVRDVLSAPEIIANSGYSYSGISLSINNHHQLEIPDRTLSGPIYGMNQWEWQFWKQPSDRAIVVLRDPRDVMISQMYSWLYSHVDTPAVHARRGFLHELTDRNRRIESMICSSGLAAGWRVNRTWANYEGSDALVVHYESLAENQHDEFGKIIDWLGWGVPGAMLHKVVDRMSFESRSGRKPGETDVHSHYRRGVAGDWRNHFTREHGQEWERLYPGYLLETGYEASNTWWESLPSGVTSTDSVESDSSGAGAAKRDSQSALIEVLQTKQKQLVQELIDKESVIQQLLIEREECESTQIRQQLQQELIDKEQVIQQLLLEREKNKADT